MALGSHGSRPTQRLSGQPLQGRHERVCGPCALYAISRVLRTWKAQVKEMEAVEACRNGERAEEEVLDCWELVEDFGEVHF